jgi:DNA-binding MarR family transcriptional regulator
MCRMKSESPESSIPPVGDRFGYLLKHARERLAALSSEALGPLGVTGRQLAVMTVLAQGEPPSQLEAAQRLAIDRTTMVSLLDELEAKGLVERRADTADRRRNIVALTDRGRLTLVEGARATDRAERTFLAALSTADADRLRELLQAVVRGD